MSLRAISRPNAKWRASQNKTVNAYIFEISLKIVDASAIERTRDLLIKQQLHQFAHERDPYRR